MALRMAMLKSAGENTVFTLGFRRWAHVAAFPPPLDGSMLQPVPSSPCVLPEFDRNTDVNGIDIGFGSEFGFPSFSSGGSMELMAVPKKKVSRHRKRVRNAPKALKPAPVIIRCMGCGRVKLPHFFCCSGERGSAEGPSVQSVDQVETS